MRKSRWRFADKLTSTHFYWVINDDLNVNVSLHIVLHIISLKKKNATPLFILGKNRVQGALNIPGWTIKTEHNWGRDRVLDNVLCTSDIILRNFKQLWNKIIGGGMSRLSESALWSLAALPGSLSSMSLPLSLHAFSQPVSVLFHCFFLLRLPEIRPVMLELRSSFWPHLDRQKQLNIKSWLSPALTQVSSVIFLPQLPSPAKLVLEHIAKRIS